MKRLRKLELGDKVAILSPSFAAPGKWPDVYELGMSRLKELFGLVPIEYPTTRMLGASTNERAQDLIAAFEDPEIMGVITTIGGNDQVTYIKDLPIEPFASNPKPFFGFSDNTHFANFLWQQGIPSYYGGSIFTQYALQGEMHTYTIDNLRRALFEEGEFELSASAEFNEIGLDWNDPSTLALHRLFEPNSGWQWDGTEGGAGVLWGGCVESVDEMLRHGISIPSLEAFNGVVLMLETSEEVPEKEYVFRVIRALGERGILKRVKGVLMGRPKAWEFNKPYAKEEREEYRQQQWETVVNTVRAYNQTIPIVQNLDFGHTEPQIPMPYGGNVRIDSTAHKIFANF